MMARGPGGRPGGPGGRGFGGGPGRMMMAGPPQSGKDLRRALRLLLARLRPELRKIIMAAVLGSVGIALVVLGHRSVGAALVFAGVGSMLAAAVVLLGSSPDKARAAVTQGAFPLVAVVLLAIGLL